ncbi:MAG: hypothetical protein E4G71_03825 [Candidatus Atribacteria bacterium]|nr:MAG: hypothetical protein E4G71_03825 [Candidatus Atribacteria bacterium]
MHSCSTPSNEYDARHSCIHGVDALQTKNEPTFPNIWEQIKADLTEYCLIMHNTLEGNIILKKRHRFGIPEYDNHLVDWGLLMVYFNDKDNNEVREEYSFARFHTISQFLDCQPI